MTIKCPQCKELIRADAADAGMDGECPICGAALRIPQTQRPPQPIAPIPPALPPVPPVPRHPPQEAVTAILRAGWICFCVGAVMMPLLLIVPVYVPVFLAAATLGIIAMAKGRTGQGLALLLCSLILPPLAALLLFLTALGAVLSLVGASPFLSPPTSAPATTPTAPAMPTRPIALDAFLSEMDSYAKAYKNGQTTVQRDEIRKRAQDRAAELLQGRDMTVQAVISDVRMPNPGHTQISYRDLNLGSYAAATDKRLHVGGEGQINLNLSRDRALSLRPGQTIQISGITAFQPGSASFLFAPVPKRPSVAIDVTIQGDYPALGAVLIQDYHCRLAAPNAPSRL